MLDQARVTASGFADRIRLHEGYIDDTPLGPFDGATCLLTLHFLAQEERVRSEEHTSELQSLMRISYAVFCLTKKKTQLTNENHVSSHQNDNEQHQTKND